MGSSPLIHGFFGGGKSGLDTVSDAVSGHGFRIASIRGFESPETGDAYLNALTIWRRFRRFTDCANGFKHLNGKSPLEAAGVDLADIDDWISHCL